MGPVFKKQVTRPLPAGAEIGITATFADSAKLWPPKAIQHAQPEMLEVKHPIGPP